MNILLLHPEGIILNEIKKALVSKNNTVFFAGTLSRARAIMETQDINTVVAEHDNTGESHGASFAIEVTHIWPSVRIILVMPNPLPGSGTYGADAFVGKTMKIGEDLKPFFKQIPRQKMAA